MSNWSFTGQPDVPAWPKDEAGREVQAVLLTHTFDAPADADTAISLLSIHRGVFVITWSMTSW